MKKSDLKSGMVVETRNGERYILCGDRFLSVENIRVSVPLLVYNDDLLLLYGKECQGDIVKVFSAVEVLSQVDTTTKLIWDREIDITRTKQVTISEIEHIFGCKVEIIKN